MPVQVIVTPIAPVQVIGAYVTPVQVGISVRPPVELVMKPYPIISYTFSKIFGSVFSNTVNNAEHLLASVIAIFVFHPDGREVSVDWQVNGTTVEIRSNVNLNNHKLIII